MDQHQQHDNAQGVECECECEYDYLVRDCLYRELTDVASLVVKSFYDKKKGNLMTRKLYQLAEANRLQQNFPYMESRSVHRMLIVEAKAKVKSKEANVGNGNPALASETKTEPTIVGFCDVDARPCATKTKLPRPYLSDLAIDPNHRRRGLARLLVEASEEFVLGTDGGKGGSPFGELWIRVASDNAAALGLYRDKLGYSFAEWSTGTDKKGSGDKSKNNNDEPEIWTLRNIFASE